MKVSGLGHFPLGAPVPDKEHAVCVSLPTFDDVIGYEEKESKTLRNLNSGYPRFVKHSRIKELSNFWARTHTLENRDLFFFQTNKTGILPKKYSISQMQLLRQRKTI